MIRKRYFAAALLFIGLNHLIDWGPFNLLVTVYAQATTVTGQVKDVNGVPYAGARLTATLANADGTTFTSPATVTQASSAVCQAAGLGPAPCNQPFPTNVGPFTLDGGGNIPGGGIALQDVTLISPAGKVWLITANTPGNPPPLGTGPQTCSATIAISGGSQNITASFAACPSLSNISVSGGAVSSVFGRTGAVAAASNDYNFNQLAGATGHALSAVLDCAAASGSGTAYTCTTSPTFVPADGDAVLFEADVANTGAATLNVNASIAASIRKQGGGTVLVANDLLAGQDTLLIYDGTNWQMQGQTGNAAGGAFIPQTNGVTNASTTGLNFLTSTVNTDGLTVTPSNPATTQEKMEITGTTLPVGGGTGVSNPTAHAIAIAEGSSNFNFIGGAALTGQQMQTNNGADPTIISPGIPGRTAAIADTILCDSATAIRDRAATEEYSAVLPVTVPDAGSAGCAANFVTLIINSTTASLVTVNRTTASTFTIFNGVTTQSALTTFPLNPGQFATLRSRDNTNWYVTLSLASALSYGTGAGTAQAQTMTTIRGPTETALIVGHTYCWKPNAANTAAAPTLAADGLAATAITKFGAVALIANDIVTTTIACAVYDGTQFELQNPMAGAVYTTSVSTGSGCPGLVVGTSGVDCQGEGTPATGLPGFDILDSNATQHARSVNNNNTGDMPISRLGCVNITPVTLPGTSTTADQDLQACTLSANLLNVVGRTLKIHTAGVYTTAAASSSAMSLEAKLCTVSGCGSGVVVDLCDITSSTLGALTISNDTWTLDCYASTQTAGASSVYERSGELVIDLLVSNAAADSVFLDPNATAVTSPVIDSTGQLFLQIVIAFTSASASNVATGRQLIVEVLN